MRFGPVEGAFLAIVAMVGFFSGIPVGIPYAFGHLLGALLVAYILVLGVRKINRVTGTPQ